MENEVNINIDDLFNSQVDEEKNNQEEKPTDDTMTKAVSERINTVRKQTEAETREKVAKELGYENYEELQKVKENKMFENAGLDSDNEEQIKLVNKLVEEKLAADPRMKKIEEFERNEKATFVSNQLKEISAMTGENYTSVDQLPQDVRELWGKVGNLKQAFLAIKGEELIGRGVSKNSSGSLKHLGDSGSNITGTKSRALTEDEKRIYRMVNPDITEEELAKKTIEN